jgi:hypothetical protein
MVVAAAAAAAAVMVVVVVVSSSQSVRDFNSAESVRYNLEDFYRRHVCVEFL